MKILFLILIISLHLQVFCQSEWYQILKQSKQHYQQNDWEVEISTTNKNVLKNDTNYYKQFFWCYKGSDKLAKLTYRDSLGFSIYKNSTTYYIYTYNNTYFVGENASDEHLKFLPYWDPNNFFEKYLRAGGSFSVKSETNEKENCYILTFGNSKDWKSILYIDKNKYSILRYSETYTHKKFGDQYYEYRFDEKSLSESHDKLIGDLDFFVNSFVETTGKTIKEKDKEHDKIKNDMIGSKIKSDDLVKVLMNEIQTPYKNQYIILDYFYQTGLPCIKNIPELNSLRTEFDTSLIIIVGIDPLPIDAGQKEKFIQRYNVMYPVIDGEKAIEVKKISLPGLTIRYPTLVLINPNGTIEYIMETYSKDHFKTLKRFLSKSSNSK